MSDVGHMIDLQVLATIRTFLAQLP